MPAGRDALLILAFLKDQDYGIRFSQFADAFFSHVNSDKHSKEKDTSSETKKRRHSTDQDEVEEENREPSGERSVKPKITMEYRNSENLDEFIQKLKVINPENSSRRSSDSGTRASLSSNGHPDQLHALSAADLPQEWNYWQDTFPQRVRIGFLRNRGKLH